MPRAKANNQQDQPAKPAPSVIATPPPPTDPAGRWETLYVYGFLIKFMHPKIDDLDLPVDFEQALMLDSFSRPMYDVLKRFLITLRPALQDTISHDNITETLIELISDLCVKIKERTVWWSDDDNKSIHPFDEVEDFFALPWDVKLLTLRQLVDWILAYSSIKEVIDISWEVKYQRKKKKTNKTAAAEFMPPSADDPMSTENLALLPLGQDSKRTRYWAVDNSPRLYTSGNPWRAICPLQAVSTTREEYIAVVQQVKASVPQPGPHGHRVKSDLLHVDLATKLEQRIDAITSHCEDVAKEKTRRQAIERARLAAEAHAMEQARIKAEKKAANAKAKGKSLKKSGTSADDDETPDTLVNEDTPDDAGSVASQSTILPLQPRPKSKGKTGQNKARASTNSMPTNLSKPNAKRKRRASSPARKQDTPDDEEIDELADDDDDEDEAMASPPPPARAKPEGESSKNTAKTKRAPAETERRKSSSIRKVESDQPPGPVPTVTAPSGSRRSSRLAPKPMDEESLVKDTRALALAANSKPSKRLKLSDEDTPSKPDDKPLLEEDSMDVDEPPKPSVRSSSLSPPPLTVSTPTPARNGVIKSSTVVSATRTPKLMNGGWAVLKDSPANDQNLISESKPHTRKRGAPS